MFYSLIIFLGVFLPILFIQFIFLEILSPKFKKQLMQSCYFTIKSFYIFITIFNLVVYGYFTWYELFMMQIPLFLFIRFIFYPVIYWSKDRGEIEKKKRAMKEKNRLREEKEKALQKEKLLQVKKRIDKCFLKAEQVFQEYIYEMKNRVVILDTNIYMNNENPLPEQQGVFDILENLERIKDIAKKFGVKIEYDSDSMNYIEIFDFIIKYNIHIYMTPKIYDEIFKLKNRNNYLARRALRTVDLLDEHDLLTIINPSRSIQIDTYADPEIISYCTYFAKQNKKVILITEDRDLKIRTNQIFKNLDIKDSIRIWNMSYFFENICNFRLHYIYNNCKSFLDLDRQQF